MPRKRKPDMSRQVAPDRAYGERARSEAALADVPITPPAGGHQPPSRIANPSGGGETGGSMLDDFLTAAQSMESPGEGLLAGDPENPEDVTSGLPIGPGPGPGLMPDLSQRGPDPSMLLWQQALPQLELLVSKPGSSPEVRQFYRRLRASLPPDGSERGG